MCVMLELGFGHEFGMTLSETKTYVNEKILGGGSEITFYRHYSSQ